MTQSLKAKLWQHIQLLDVFKKCEDLEDEDALKTMYEIFKSIWMLNQGDIYEILFKQDYIFVSFVDIVLILVSILGCGWGDGVRSL